MEYTNLFDKTQFNKFKNEIEKYNDFEEYGQSTAILRNSITCFPNHPGLYYLMALTNIYCKEYIRAQENFKKAIKLDDSKIDYMGIISTYFYCINDLESSYTYALKAYEIENRDIDAVITLGKIELLRNNYEESLTYGVIAVEIDENNFRAVRLLSRIYISMGVEEKDTLSILYRARTLGRDEDISLDIIKLLYLNGDYVQCLKECKLTIINHETGYVVSKAEKFISSISERFMSQNISTAQGKEKVNMLNNDSKGENKINSDSKRKTMFKDPVIDNIDNIINHIEAIESSNEEVKNEEKHEEIKKEVKKEVEESIKDEKSAKKTLSKRSSRHNRNSESDDIKRDTDSLEDALEKLNSLTGLKNVKREINKIVQLVKYQKNRENALGLDKIIRKSYNFEFLGNPGTGKTTVARLVGDIFYYLGILDKGQLIEVDRSDIVGKFIGETAKLTKKFIDKSMGGILFIDEAYTLAKGGQDSNDYGKEAIETLLKSMEDERGNFVVILAGYNNEMRNLMKLNPGLSSRINIKIEFEDYSDDELLSIGENMAFEDEYVLNDEAKKAFLEKINIQKVDDNFANARCVRNLLEDAILEKAYRLGDKECTKEEYTTLTSEDFGVDLEFTARDKVKDSMSELDNLVGLSNIKSVVKKILDTLELNHKKKEMGINIEDISLNMVFSGNPGTGKTTVARIIGKILKDMGILKKGHIVEVTRSDLVGKYVGETAPKTLDKIKEAYGGILFIDEAYTLNSKSESDFGREAIATLIKEMEDNRDKLIVIMAGYTNEMKDLIDLNPGLSSRIKFNLEFEDYNEDELLQIFKILAKHEKYTISNNAYKKLKDEFKYMVEHKDKNFGNGRSVRKFFEDIKMKQASRVIEEKISERKEMLKITNEDI